MATINQATPPILPEDTADLPAEDQGIIERFKARIAEFRDLLARLRGVRDRVPPAMQGEYQDLINRGNVIEGTIDNVTGAINNAVNWFKGAFGLDAVSMARSGQLGVIPLLPVAAVTGAMTLIGYWYTDTQMFIKRVDAVLELVRRGSTPEEALAIVKGAGEKPSMFGFDLQKLVVPLLIAGGLWWFMRNKRL